MIEEATTIENEENVLEDVGKDVLKELSERQRDILEMIAIDSTISAKAFSEKISEKKSVTDRTIENDLAHLKKLGILLRKGGRKDGKWIIIGEKNVKN